MIKRDFALGKMNFLLIGVAVVLIVIGFLLMSGGAPTDPEGVTFNPDIFSTRRIVVAPVVTMIGFLLMIAGILVNAKAKRVEE